MAEECCCKPARKEEGWESRAQLKEGGRNPATNKLETWETYKVGIREMEVPRNREMDKTGNREMDKVGLLWQLSI